MLTDLESWPAGEKTKFLARPAHELTVCARGTYEVGTARVLQPDTLRDYNEIQHRVTGSLVTQLQGTPGMTPTTVLEMVRDFAVRHQREDWIEGAIARVEKRMTTA